MIRSFISSRHFSVLVLSISFMLMGCEQQFGISTFSVDDQSNVEIGGPALPTASGGSAPAPVAAPTVDAAADPVAAPAPVVVAAPAPAPAPAPVAPSSTVVTTAPAPAPAPAPAAGSSTAPVADADKDGEGTIAGGDVQDPISDVVNVPVPVSTPVAGAPAAPIAPVAPVAPMPPKKGRHIIVNIQSVMVRMQEASGSKLKNALVAKDLGKTDLLALAPGVLGSARLNTGAILNEVELRLFETGHEVIEDGVVICTLKVPSLKFQMKFHSVEVKADVRHSIQLPESEIQVHFIGPKECSLRPVGWPNLVEVSLQ